VWFNGDPTRLSQCVGNLLGNAIKFTERGGRITVRLDLEPSGGAALVQVRDTGIGMDPETLARAFDPFAQGQHGLNRSHGGLGLGLSLVRAMVQLHGGTVEARSDGQRRGTTFTIRLPLPGSPHPARPPQQAPLVGSDDRPQRVLLIEDNVDAAESLLLLLGLWGHEVAVASSGAEGVDMAVARPPDVVLCDIGLPGKMDGYEVARALRAHPATSSARIIAMSGYGTAEDQRQAFDAGFDRHLTKPVDPDVLHALLAPPVASSREASAHPFTRIGGPGSEGPEPG
jgi:two-component system CheB/CheR fusion protein